MNLKIYTNIILEQVYIDSKYYISPYLLMEIGGKSVEFSKLTYGKFAIACCIIRRDATTLGSDIVSYLKVWESDTKGATNSPYWTKFLNNISDEIEDTGYVNEKSIVIIMTPYLNNLIYPTDKFYDLLRKCGANSGLKKWKNNISASGWYSSSSYLMAGIPGIGTGGAIENYQGGIIPSTTDGLNIQFRYFLTKKRINAPYELANM